MISDLTLQSQQVGDKAIITTNGYINHTGGEKIAHECYRFIDAGINKIILDLKGSKVVNSIGISILIEIIEKLNQVEGKLFFMNLESSVEKTLQIMGIFQFSSKIDSIDEAD